jgi:hypothetical protein
LDDTGLEQSGDFSGNSQFLDQDDAQNDARGGDGVGAVGGAYDSDLERLILAWSGLPAGVRRWICRLAGIQVDETDL